jgi:1-deoxy-D-xylulose-5-phosphate reductoisomerase
MLNAANEVAVEAFLASRIGFLDIAAVVAETLERMSLPEPVDLAAAVACDEEARRVAAEFVARRPVPAGST